MTVLLLFCLYAVLLSVGLARAGHRSAAAEFQAHEPERLNRVLIIGATGGTGRELVKQALARGYEVTALVRSSSKAIEKGPHLRVILGDVLDPASLEKAMRGQEAVLCALGHRRFYSLKRILSVGMHNIIKSMESNGVQRLVCETALGIGNSAGRLGLYYTFFVIPVILPFYFWDKTRQERILVNSGTDWIIVRPGALTNGPRRGILKSGRNVGSFFWTNRIARANVADFMFDQIESNAHLRTAVGVC